MATKAPPADALGHNFAPDLVTPLLIGSGGNQNSVFGGVIDEVAIYRTVLAATDVTNHYQTAFGTNATYGANYKNAVLANSPIIYLRLDEPAFNSAPNLSACQWPTTTAPSVRRPTATTNPAPPRASPVPAYTGFGGSSHAVALDGFNAGVDVGLGSVPALLNPTGSQPMTVMTWFRANPSDCVGRYQKHPRSWRFELASGPGSNRR